MQICNVHCVSKNMPDIITALQNADAATQSSNENSVCPSVRPSVCPSVCQTRALWQNGRKIWRTDKQTEFLSLDHVCILQRGKN